jgi:hypothetical protein
MNLLQMFAVAIVNPIPEPSTASSGINLFQILAVAIVGGLFALSVVAMFRGWATRREGLVWAFVWLCTGVAIARPDLTVLVAGAMGIGRGADLVLYCAVIVMLIGFFMVYARLRRLRRDLTLLSRHLAIRDAASTPPTGRPVPPRGETN